MQADWNFEKQHAELKVGGKLLTTKKVKPAENGRMESAGVIADFENIGWVRARSVWYGLLCPSDKQTASCYRALSKSKPKLAKASKKAKDQKGKPEKAALQRF